MTIFNSVTQFYFSLRGRWNLTAWSGALCFRPVWHGLFQLSHLHVEHLTNESHFRNVITRCLIDTESNITLTAIFNLFLPKWNLTENEDAKNINMDSHSFPEYCQVYSKALLLRMKCFTAKRLWLVRCIRKGTWCSFMISIVVISNFIL